MERKGPFTHKDVPFLINTAGKKQFSCVLAFKTGTRTVRVFFEKGKIAFISSTDPDERFGEYLLYQEKISLEQYNIASQRLIKEGQKMGALLIDQGFISYEESLTSLGQYILDLGSSLFREKRGFYAFLKPENPSLLPMELFLDHRKFLYKGIREYNMLSMIQNIVPDNEAMPNFTESSESVLRCIDIGVEEQSILEWINGRNSVKAICNYSSLSEFETLKVLAALSYCEFISFSKEGPTHMSLQQQEFLLEDLVRKYNQSFERIYQWLHNQEDDAFQNVHHATFETIQEEYKQHARDLDLKNYGFLDFEIFYKNVYSVPADERLEFSENMLKAILKGLIVETGRLLGKTAMQELKEELSKYETTN